MIHLRQSSLFVGILIVILLVATIIGTSTALSVKKQVAKEKADPLTEIIPENAEWEKVVASSENRFMEGINFDQEDKIWLVSHMTNELLTVDGEEVKFVETIDGAVGAKFHKDGRLFITSITGNLYAYDPKTETTSVILDSYNDQPFNGLNDLVFDDEGGLYFTDPMGSDALNPSGKVYYLPPGEEEAILFADNIAYPNGIAISADGNRVYISEFDKNRVISVPSITAETSPETSFLFAQFEGGIGPDGLAVDTEGNLYVAHFQAGQIVVVDQNGFKYGAIKLPEDAGTFVTNLAFHDGYLYITESSKNEILRIKVNKEGLELYGSKSN